MHKKIHNGQKYQQCNRCDFASIHMRMLMKTHNGEKSPNATSMSFINYTLQACCTISSLKMAAKKDFLLSRLPKWLPLVPPVERCAAAQRAVGVLRWSGRATATQLAPVVASRQSGQGAVRGATDYPWCDIVCSESCDAAFNIFWKSRNVKFF